MANRVPFTAYFRFTPEYGSGKRFEIWRSREKIAHLVHDQLIANFTDGNIALPGGSAHWGLAADESSFSCGMNAVAVKPQMGEFPDTLTVVGFWDPAGSASDDVNVPYGQETIISVNRVVTGPGTGRGARALGVTPTAACNVDAAALVSQLLAAMGVDLITKYGIEIIKLEISGQLYGHGGVHL